MSKLTKNQKLALGKIEAGKAYTLKEASALVKEITTSKFDASVDVDVRLGVDPENQPAPATPERSTIPAANATAYPARMPRRMEASLHMPRP